MSSVRGIVLIAVFVLITLLLPSQSAQAVLYRVTDLGTLSGDSSMLAASTPLGKL